MAERGRGGLGGGMLRLLAGTVAGWYVARNWFGVTDWPGMVGALVSGAIGGLLPDIDARGSLFWWLALVIAGLKILLWLADGEFASAAALFGVLLVTYVVVPRLLGRQGVTHSLLAWALAAAGWWWLHVAFGDRRPLAMAASLAAAYGAHIWLDMLTPAGVPLLWPWQRRFGVVAALAAAALAAVLALTPAGDWLRGAVASLVFGGDG